MDLNLVLPLFELFYPTERVQELLHIVFVICNLAFAL